MKHQKLILATRLNVENTRPPPGSKDSFGIGQKKENSDFSINSW
jgi:hypothetical protein